MSYKKIIVWVLLIAIAGVGLFIVHNNTASEPLKDKVKTTDKNVIREKKKEQIGNEPDYRMKGREDEDQFKDSPKIVIQRSDKYMTIYTIEGKNKNSGDPLRINVAVISPKVKIYTSYNTGKLKKMTVARQAREFGLDGVAINASFFRGVCRKCRKKGKTCCQHYDAQPLFGVKPIGIVYKDGKRMDSESESPIDGSVFDDWIGFRADGSVQFGEGDTCLSDIKTAVSGYFLLKTTDGGTQYFMENGTDDAYMRTAVGVKKNGYIVACCVDGERGTNGNPNKGLTLSELMWQMHCFGCEDAVMLDGGGSTQFVVAEKNIDTESDGELEKNGEKSEGNISVRNLAIINDAESTRNISVGLFFDAEEIKE